MSTFLTAFNNLVIKFNDELIETFPEENDFKVSKNGILLLKKANPRKIVTIFKKYTEIYREKISNEDEDFFLQNDYNDVVNNDSEKDNVFFLIDKLKKYWTVLSDSNKKNVWKYLNTLMCLSDKC